MWGQLSQLASTVVEKANELGHEAAEQLVRRAAAALQPALSAADAGAATRSPRRRCPAAGCPHCISCCRPASQNQQVDALLAQGPSVSAPPCLALLPHCSAAPTTAQRPNRLLLFPVLLAGQRAAV